jgi:phenylpropionate dioxygenase-like ring-hydroxylating dioxygenase large terminal subunit
MTPFAEPTRQHWFPLALSRDLRAKPRRVMFFGAPLVLGRDAGGRAFALEDRCAHRGVPLSSGRITAAGVLCPYHGWTFDADGRCTRMPGTADECPLAEVRVPSLATQERDGLVWVSQSREAALPERALALSSAHRRFLWQTRWRAPIVEVQENFLDPLHTHEVHPGLVRRGARRPVRAVLQRAGDGFHVDYAGNEQQSGLLFKLFESPRTLERAWFSGLSVAQLEYRYASGWSACITLHCAPETTHSTHVFATLHVMGRFAPAWLVRLFVWPFLRRVATQDQAMLELQQQGVRDFAGRREIVSPLDLTRPYLDAAWRASPGSLPAQRQVDLLL